MHVLPSDGHSQDIEAVLFNYTRILHRDSYLPLQQGFGNDWSVGCRTKPFNYFQGEV